MIPLRSFTNEKSRKLVLGRHDNDELGIVCTLVDPFLCISESFSALPDALLLVDRSEARNDRAIQDFVPLLLQLISKLLQEHEEHCALLDVVERHPAAAEKV